MLAAAHHVEVGEHRDVIQNLIERGGGVNTVAQQVGGLQYTLCFNLMCTNEDVYSTE